MTHFPPNTARKAVLGLLLIACLALKLEPSQGGELSANDKPEVVRSMVIVAPEALHSAIAPFLAHKQRLMPAEYHSLESVLGETEGVDHCEKLKRFLYRRWRSHNLGYALLVGDIDLLPVRYMVLDRVTPTAWDYAFYPSDLYYADLAKPDGTFDDWNAQKSSFHAGYFGEVRGEKNKADPINFDAVDYRPEIAVGRWPVSTLEEAGRVAAKTIAFEQAVLANKSGSTHEAAFVAAAGWVDSRNLLDRLSSRLPDSWHIDKLYYADARRPGGTSPSHEQVRALLNRGVDLMVHTGHGQPDAWERCFSVPDLDRLTNTHRLTVFISAGCSTACFAPLPPYGSYVDVDGKKHAGTDRGEVFDGPPPPPALYQRGRFNPSGLGEQLLKRNLSGGIAYIGCNTGSQPCALTLVEGFVSSWTLSSLPRLGDCWAGAIRHYYDQEGLARLKPDSGWYPPSIFFQGMKFMLFGDPSLRLPNGQREGG